MSKGAKVKPTYEAPLVMPLGELARALGQSCHPGTEALGGCSVGTSALSPACNLGTIAGGACSGGNMPKTSCNAGQEPK